MIKGVTKKDQKRPVYPLHLQQYQMFLAPQQQISILMFFRSSTNNNSTDSTSNLFQGYITTEKVSNAVHSCFPLSPSPSSLVLHKVVSKSKFLSFSLQQRESLFHLCNANAHINPLLPILNNAASFSLSSETVHRTVQNFNVWSDISTIYIHIHKFRNISIIPLTKPRCWRAQRLS